MNQKPAGFKTYLKDIGQYRVLTKEEEFSLFERLCNGDESVREEIVSCNLRLVVRLALRFQGKGLNLEDLIQEGNIGLLEVIDRFDHTLGFRFSTYAAFWIRQAIQVAVRKNGSMIRLPVRKARMLGKISEVVQEGLMLNGRPPSVEAIAARLEVDVAQIDELMKLSKTTLSLDMPLDEDGGTLQDKIEDTDSPSPVEQTMTQEMQRRMDTVLRQLSEREHAILSLRFGLKGSKGKSLRVVSRHVGLSQEGVRRVEQRALHKLARPHMRQQLTGLI